MGNIAKIIKQHDLKTSHDVLWKGPQVEGITFSLLSRWLACRERFRLYAILGLAPPERWNHRLGYGNMWHVCEQALSAYFKDEHDPRHEIDAWEQALEQHYKEQCALYPFQQKEIYQWWHVCLAQFPVYVDYWRHHPDNLDRQPIFQERTFNVRYPLPSGRTVRLRGKWDAVDYLSLDGSRKVWLQENKTKGDVDSLLLANRLKADLQSMLYLSALVIQQKDKQSPRCEKSALPPSAPIGGVRYNVVRRPLSGGRHTIRQHQPTKKNPSGESTAAYYQRLHEAIAGEPEYFFHRWEVKVNAESLAQFQQRTLNPMLEQLCDWYDWIMIEPDNPWRPWNESYGCLHWTHPHGVYNAVDEGAATPYDEMLYHGSELGLVRTTNLFPELQGG